MLHGQRKRADTRSDRPGCLRGLRRVVVSRRLSSFVVTTARSGSQCVDRQATTAATGSNQ